MMQDEALTAVLGDHASLHSVPGAALAILQDGVVREACWGVADVATGEPVGMETRFPLGSASKPVTATVLARLAGRGELSLDDPVAEHLDELQDSHWAHRATVRDLLANRSGIPLRAALEFGLDGDEPDALSRCARLVAEADDARLSPAGRGVGGSTWSYSNIGWCLAGCIIERVTGQPWEEATRTDVLEPAGMARTTFALARQTEPRASGHTIVDGSPTPVPPWDPRVYCSAGTSLLATVTDLLSFVAWQSDEPACPPLWQTHAETPIHGWLDAWCLGWARFDWSTHDSVLGWDGLMPGHRLVLRFLPEQRAAVVLAMNGDTGRAMYRSLFTDHFHDWFDIRMPALNLEPSPGVADPLERFSGLYGWPDRRCRVTAAADALTIDVDGRERAARPTSDRTFLVDPDEPDNPTVTFGDFDAQGRPGTIYLMLWGLPRLDRSVSPRSSR
jgi:CubicO group peptidase (beta-lactamase class C family)